MINVTFFQDIEHIEKGEIPMLDKKSWTSRGLRGIWGKRSPAKRGNKFPKIFISELTLFLPFTSFYMNQGRRKIQRIKGATTNGS